VNLDLDSGVTAGVEDFAADDELDLAHGTPEGGKDLRGQGIQRPARSPALHALITAYRALPRLGVLDLVPQAVEQREMLRCAAWVRLAGVEVDPSLAGEKLQRLEAVPELLCCRSQRGFRIHLEVPGDVDDGEQQVTDLLANVFGRTGPARLEHFVELMNEIHSWARTIANAEEIERIFARYNLATGRLRSVGEIAETSWATERQAIVSVSDRGDGTVRVPNSPWHFSGSDTSVQGVAKYRGEDNVSVCREILGMSSEEIESLERDGVLVSRVPKN